MLTKFCEIFLLPLKDCTTQLARLRKGEQKGVIRIANSLYDQWATKLSEEEQEKLLYLSATDVERVTTLKKIDVTIRCININGTPNWKTIAIVDSVKVIDEWHSSQADAIAAVARLP